MKTSTLVLAAAAVVVGLVVIVALAPLLSGPPRPGVDLIVALDVSGSFEERLQQGRVAVWRTVERLDSKRDGLTLLRFDHKTEEIGGSDLIGNEGALLDVLKHQAVVKKGQQGTVLAEMLDEVTKHAQRANRPVIILIVTDGFNDDMTANGLERLREAGDRLAECTNVVRVIVVGPEPGAREDWREGLAALGDRFELRSLAPLTRRDLEIDSEPEEGN